MEYLRVQGHDGLVREKSSGAIINTNRTEYDEYMERVRLAEEKDSLISQHTAEINNIKNELQDIKTLLLKLVNKG
jgi:hypothetical protein